MIQGVILNEQCVCGELCMLWVPGACWRRIHYLYYCSLLGCSCLLHYVSFEYRREDDQKSRSKVSELVERDQRNGRKIEEKGKKEY